MKTERVLEKREGAGLVEVVSASYHDHDCHDEPDDLRQHYTTILIKRPGM